MTNREDRATPEEELGALAALPHRDAEAAIAARILRVSRRAFEQEHAAGRPPWLSPIAHAWSRFVVPAVLAGAAAAYLVWAFTITLYP